MASNANNPYLQSVQRFKGELERYAASRSAERRPLEGCELTTYQRAMKEIDAAVASASLDSLIRVAILTPLLVGRAERAYETYRNRYMLPREAERRAVERKRVPSEGELLRIHAIAENPKPNNEGGIEAWKWAVRLDKQTRELSAGTFQERLERANDHLKLMDEVVQFFEQYPQLRP